MAVEILGVKNIGDYVKIKIDGTLRDFIVVHKGPPSAYYDVSFEGGVILLMKDLFEIRAWHGTGVNDYENSDIHAWLNGVFLNLIDPDIRNQIKQVKIPFRPGSGTSSVVMHGSDGLPASAFLLSGYEVGSGGAGYLPGDGTTLDYFAGINTTSGSAKRIAHFSGVATDWYLRSPSTAASSDVWMVNRGGGVASAGAAFNPQGIRPALVLPSSAYVADDGTIIVKSSAEITGQDTHLGTFAENGPFYSYTVTDEEQDTIQVTEAVDGKVYRVYEARSGEGNTFNLSGNDWRCVLNGTHTLTITAIGGNGISAVRTLIFYKDEDVIEFYLARPMESPLAERPSEVSVKLTPEIPPGATLAVKATNNAFENGAVWEDITAAVVSGQAHTFANEETAVGRWGVDLHVKVDRGSATGDCRISGLTPTFKTKESDIIPTNRIPLSVLPVGALLRINANNAARNSIIVHHGKPSSIYDDSFNGGVILLMEEIYELRQWHSSNVNDYAGSTIHDYLNSTFLGLMDAGIRAQVKQVKIPYRPGSGNSRTVNSGANGLPAYIWLLSGYELNWTAGTSPFFPEDGATLSYFGGTAPIDAKRIAFLNGIATSWWLRTIQTNDVAAAAGVHTNGNHNSNYCTHSNGIRPAFVLPNTLFVDAAPNPDGSYNLILE